MLYGNYVKEVEIFTLSNDNDFWPEDYLTKEFLAAL